MRYWIHEPNGDFTPDIRRQVINSVKAILTESRSFDPRALPRRPPSLVYIPQYPTKYKNGTNAVSYADLQQN